MRVFVTGASGWIGSAVLPELIGAGHQVVGLARSDSAAAAIAAAGADVLRGDLDDLDTLHAGATGSDGVIHLAFIHDFTDFAASVTADRRARVARARLSELAADSSVAWRMSAVSAVLKPSTSRSTSTARWRGGSSCSAVMNASEIVSTAS